MRTRLGFTIGYVIGFIITAAALPLACTPPQQISPSVVLQLEEQVSGTRSLLIGVSPVNDRIVWASGSGGGVVRTEDGGATWTGTPIPEADTLQFRDIHGVDSDVAYVLSSGTGSASRIYKTVNGGLEWTLQFVNDEPRGFFDCMDFWDPETGIAFGDEVDGEFMIMRTTDGGENWNRIPPESVPDATEGEGSFAASGRCVATVGDSLAYIGTGAGASARILKTTDRGLTWTDFETPIHDGTPTSGISSLSWRSETAGYAFGLELGGRDSTIHNVIRTLDGGRTWEVLEPPQLPDVYGGTHVPGLVPTMLVAVGPKGIDYSVDDGLSWMSASKLNYWSVAFANESTGWAVGPGGRITKISVSSEQRTAGNTTSSLQP